MTPRGSLPLKVRIPGCAPIRRASGTHDKAVRKRLVGMIHALHEQGRDDLVNAVAVGRLKPLQVFNRWKFNRLADLPHADEFPVFADAWPTWVAAIEGDDHRASCAVWCRRLESVMRKGARIGDAVAALASLRVSLKAHPRSYNLARTTLQAFYRDTVGQRHQFWIAVAESAPLKVKPTRKKRPLTPDQLRALVKALGDPWGGMVWTMATTGMGWREYTGAWEREANGLRIHGSKTEGRDRLIPLVSLLFQPQRTVHALRWHLNRAEPRIAPYDLRRTFVQLMIEAGVPRPRRSLYLGHSPEDITAIYEMAEVREYLERDAERIRAVLGEPEQGPILRVVGVKGTTKGTDLGR